MLTTEFILAGKAIFTVQNPSGERYTFRIARKEANERFQETYFVSLLTGPDNTSDFTYMDMLNPVSFTAYPTRASKMTVDSRPFKVLDWVLNNVKVQKQLPIGYTLCHEGRCGRCGRLLTVPSSVESGIGPECAKKMVFA